MKRYTIRNLASLLDLVGASGPYPSEPGPVVVHAKIWDGRVVKATYYNGPKYQHPDAETEYDFFRALEPLRPLVDTLLREGQEFVTVTGTDDMVCCLEWTIE